MHAALVKPKTQKRISIGPNVLVFVFDERCINTIIITVARVEPKYHKYLVVSRRHIDVPARTQHILSPLIALRLCPTYCAFRCHSVCDFISLYCNDNCKTGGACREMVAGRLPFAGQNMQMYLANVCDVSYRPTTVAVVVVCCKFERREKRPCLSAC